jgi:hypothetical protein
MDEILTAIRRIIADDEQSGHRPPVPEWGTAGTAVHQWSAPAGRSRGRRQRHGHLRRNPGATEAVNEDGTVRHLAPIGGTSRIAGLRSRPRPQSIKPEPQHLRLKCRARRRRFRSQFREPHQDGYGAAERGIYAFAAAGRHFPRTLVARRASADMCPRRARPPEPNYANRRAGTTASRPPSSTSPTVPTPWPTPSARREP